jgi:hypothetical protein
MKTNMVFWDRVLRMFLAIAIAVLHFSGVIPAGVGLWLMIIAVVFMITSYTGFCPLYGMFGYRPKSH